MKKLLAVLIAGFLLVGCGTQGEVSQGENTNGGAQKIIAGEIVPTLIETSPLIFEYQIKNQKEVIVNLTFTSSQRFDYSVKTTDGKELFLYSSVASFLQALGEEELIQGEELEYEIDVRELNLEPGQYVLSAWMTPKEGNKYTTSIEFTVE